MNRVRRRRLLATLMAALTRLAAALASPVGASAASATRTPFTAIFYGCSNAPPSAAWVSGPKILHFRNAVNNNYWVASTPFLTGPESNVVDGNVNLESGFGVAHSREVLMPAGYAGTWEFDARIKVTPDGLQADAVGHGTGVFKGMLPRWTQTGEIVVDPGSNPCGGDPFAATFAGDIQVPASAA